MKDQKVTLQQVEQKYNIRYPELFRRLYSDGMLDWGELSPGWYQREFPRLKENPPLLLAFGDIEFFYFDQVDQRMEDLMNPPYYRIVDGLSFIPFGFNGAGDHYVFQFDRAQGEDVPVVLMPHDDDSATIMARNLQDFIFSMLLSELSGIDEHSIFITSDGNNTLAMNTLRTHGPYLTDRQVEVLTDLYNRPVVRFDGKYSNGASYSYRGIITYEEQEEIVKSVTGYDKLYSSFVFMEYDKNKG